MSTGTGERALLILATMFVAVILYQTAHLGPVARLVPLTIAVPTLMLLVLQLVRDLSPALGRLADQRGLRPVLTRPRARLTQITSLALLAPDIQEAVLFLPAANTGASEITERHLRPVVAAPDWQTQRRLWARLTGTLVVGNCDLSPE